MHVALTGLLLLGSCPALAFDNDRFTLSAGYELGYDTNVFRLPSQAEAPQPTPGNPRRGDQLSAATIGIRYHDQIGRQAFEAGLVEVLYRYKTFRSLDNNAMASEVRWAGEVGNSWRPLLEWTRRKNLAGFADVRIPVRNIQTTDRLNMELRYAATPSWEALGILSGERLTNDAPEQAALDYRMRTVELGVAHTPPSANRVELHLRYIDARYPNSSLFPFGLVDPSPGGLLDYVQKEVLFTGLYTPTGWGEIAWQIGYGARRYSAGTDRSLDTPIGGMQATRRRSLPNIRVRSGTHGLELRSLLPQRRVQPAHWVLTACLPLQRGLHRPSGQVLPVLPPSRALPQAQICSAPSPTLRSTRSYVCRPVGCLARRPRCAVICNGGGVIFTGPSGLNYPAARRPS
jgi:hypothetical protein